MRNSRWQVGDDQRTWPGLRVVLWAVFVGLFAGFWSGDAGMISAAETPAAGQQVGLRFTSPTAPGDGLSYLLFLPQGHRGPLKDGATAKPDSPTKTWPVLLFLHGAGESGDDLQKVKVHGPPKLVEQRPADFPYIVVSPQAPTNQIPYVDRWQPRLLAELVDEVVAQFGGDADRLYVTGLSMGGYGTIRLCAHYPRKFAAAAPICGGGWSNYGEPLASLPMWFFHGDADTVVPVERSLDVVRAMRSHGGRPRLTIYESVAHDSWTQTYNNPALYEWLLSHRLSTRPALPAKQR